MNSLKSIEKKSRFCLTKRDWALLIISLVGLIFGIVSNFQSFLEIDKPINSDILVVEGWLPDYALKQAIDEFNSKGYKLLITTGGPLLKGYPLSEYKTEAELAESIIKIIGFTKEKIIAVPAHYTIKDRTYTSACALKKWVEDSNQNIKTINLFSLGTHSRRSWILFKKALGDSIKVGIISADDFSYDPEHWWKSSDGVRTVLSEMIAYIYARFFFHPKE